MDIGEHNDLVDLRLLTSEERRLWNATFPDPPDRRNDRPAILLYSFGYGCMLELGHVPDVVHGRLTELDPGNQIGTYFESARSRNR